MAQWNHHYVTLGLNLAGVFVELRFIGAQNHFAIANQSVRWSHRETDGRPDFTLPLSEITDG